MKTGTKFERPEIKPLTKKAKRKRRGQDCTIKRTAQGYNVLRRCLICGSENLVKHGVWCCRLYYHEEGQGEVWDVFPVGDYPSWFQRGNTPPEIPGCNHGGKYAHFYAYVTACVDCGAVKRGKCPVCKRRWAWRSSTGELKCTTCGFRGKI